MVKFMDKPETAKAPPRIRPRPEAAQKPDAARQKSSDAEWPAEGPHARSDLINEEATPGCGLFSNKTVRDGKKVDPGAG